MVYSILLNLLMLHSSNADQSNLSLFTELFPTDGTVYAIMKWIVNCFLNELCTGVVTLNVMPACHSWLLVTVCRVFKADLIPGRLVSARSECMVYSSNLPLNATLTLSVRQVTAMP